MSGWQSDVREFHRVMGATIGDGPDIRDPELRARLIAEEAAETIAALGFDVQLLVSKPSGARGLLGEEVADFYRPAKRDLAGLIDGVADTIYVLLGTMVAAGVELDPFWDAVHAANMAKANGPVREDGKRLKPEGWAPPNIEGLLEAISDPGPEEQAA